MRAGTGICTGSRQATGGEGAGSCFLARDQSAAAECCSSTTTTASRPVHTTVRSGRWSSPLFFFSRCSLISCILFCACGKEPSRKKLCETFKPSIVDVQSVLHFMHLSYPPRPACTCVAQGTVSRTLVVVSGGRVCHAMCLGEP